MFTTGWAAPRRRSVCRTADVLALKAHNLDATTFWSAPQISATLPQRHRQFCASSSLTEGTRALDVAAVVTPEESARRVMVEATRLASLAPGEWRLWIDRSAERLRIPRATLQDLIVAIIKSCSSIEMR